MSGANSGEPVRERNYEMGAHFGLIRRKESTWGLAGPFRSFRLKIGKEDDDNCSLAENQNQADKEDFQRPLWRSIAEKSLNTDEAPDTLSGLEFWRLFDLIRTA